ncbi:hypothetical protein E2C01_083393 [Portunus trituberculatus]|uniref:Uncharacterized protein n=1 Tax=Portunus trituberculatus TaxID=210409 RepID=A0A5B7J6H1_PORTR|nr:hypothetical protein [Portunus trituberculatus]
MLIQVVGTAVRNCSSDVYTDGGVFIPLWAFTSSIEALTGIRSFDVDFCVERLVSLLHEDVKKRHASVGDIFYAEVKTGGLLEVMSKLFYVGFVLRFDEYVVYNLQ